MFFRGRKILPLRQRHKRLLKSILFITVIVVGAFLASYLPGKHPNPSFRLAIYDIKDVSLHHFVVTPGDEVTLSYRHSSDGTPVVQIFQVGDDGYLYLLEEQYSWHGAGLEHGSGYDFSFEGDTVRITGYKDERRLERLFLRVARTVPQELEVNGEVVQLSDLAPGGTRLFLQVEED